MKQNRADSLPRLTSTTTPFYYSSYFSTAFYGETKASLSNQTIQPPRMTGGWYWCWAKDSLPPVVWGVWSPSTFLILQNLTPATYEREREESEEGMREILLGYAVRQDDGITERNQTKHHFFIPTRLSFDSASGCGSPSLPVHLLSDFTFSDSNSNPSNSNSDFFLCLCILHLCLRLHLHLRHRPCL
ncbi:hypothetical protein LENED_012766 [Lentinula edodes]|uniref:Uncharacterized protein n=1 Tax=Lentinula edodes TaxID=5353 RepID=A0A1Q3ETJ8_LENED|nr:hypothetical protein LENED_012766 [Lentinula edodes]